MKRLIPIITAVLLSTNALADSPNVQPETQTIPLDQIWAYKMAGTRDIQELDKAQAEVSTMGLVALISEAWVLRADDLKGENLARPGFAVSGVGLSALRIAHSVFVDGKKPPDVFSPDEEISVVFFSEPVAGNRVQIREVNRQGDNVVIRYCLEPNVGGYRTLNFALIPLGKLRVGKYGVKMHQLPTEKKFVELGYEPLDKQWSRQFLCQPFLFRVTEKGE